MLSVYNQTYVKHLRLKLCIFLIRSDKPQEILCSGKPRLRIVYYKTHVVEIVLVALITICGDHRELCYQFHTLSENILNAYIIRIIII